MQCLLFMEPTRHASSVPLIDRLTRKLCAAFRQATNPCAAPGVYGGCRGRHECICGALSSSHDHYLPNGDLTNSLCVHYLAHHRSEVPPDALLRVDAFDCGESEPSDEELQGPEHVLARIRENAERMIGPDWLRAWSEWGLDVEALCLALRGFSNATGNETRRDAGALYEMLHSIPPEAIRLVEQVLRQRFGDPRVWGAGALRLPRWQRDAWVGLVDGLLRLPPGDPQEPQSSERIAEGMLCSMDIFLWPEDGSSVPTLLELAKRTGLCQDLCIGALDDISRIPGVLVPETTLPALAEVTRESAHDPQLRDVAGRLLGAVQQRTWEMD
jgi:hypothetical protein